VKVDPTNPLDYTNEYLLMSIELNDGTNVFAVKTGTMRAACPPLPPSWTDHSRHARDTTQYDTIGKRREYAQRFLAQWNQPVPDAI
jgi:hypothetical protein